MNNSIPESSYKSAFQKASHQYPIGVSEVCFTVEKNAFGEIKILKICAGGGVQAPISPVAHAGLGPIPRPKAEHGGEGLRDKIIEKCNALIKGVANGNSTFDSGVSQTANSILWTVLNYPAAKPEQAKHYKCPKCHTRFTREYPYKPSDTKEVKPEQEPLEELAKRKGYRHLWAFEMCKDDERQETCFAGDTVLESESKARAYLEPLPDKKEPKQ